MKYFLKLLLASFALALCFGLYSHFTSAPTSSTTSLKAVPASPNPEPTPNPNQAKIVALMAFFEHYKCPDNDFNGFYFIDDYIHAADKYQIPYNLLPAISVIESQCGRHYPKATNNLWGWDSARSGFASIPDGIDYVSQQLGEGRYYRGKNINQILRAYNPNPAYAPEVERLMKEISNEP